MQKKILLIDDDMAILDSLSLLLEQLGYSIETLSEGKHALEEIKKRKPDVILLDLLMSGSDGSTICRKLKNDPTLRNIPVIMISAHPSAHKGALDSGANAFLAKPFELDKLQNTLQNTIYQ